MTLYLWVPNSSVSLCCYGSLNQWIKKKKKSKQEGGLDITRDCHSKAGKLQLSQPGAVRPGMQALPVSQAPVAIMLLS